MRGLLFAAVAALITDTEGNGIFFDEVKQVFARPNHKLNVRPRLTRGVAPTQKVYRRFTLRISLPKLFALCYFVLGLGILVSYA